MVQEKIIENPSKNSIKRSWQKVKIKGKVISDDVAGLEGLIGLEVLEKYDKHLVTKQKRPKRPPRKENKVAGKRKRSGSISQSSDDEEDEGKPKKKKKANKKGKTPVKRIPGQFVLLKPPANIQNEELVETTKTEDQEGVESKISIDDLVGWNGLGVPEPILKAIAENGFKCPTEIQSLTLPAAIMGKKDILGAAETGSGKTLAFGIPILSGIMELKKKNVKSGVRKIKQDVEKKKHKERENFTPPPEELDDYPEIDDDECDEYPDTDKPLYALILTPTRELAVQVRDHIVAVAKYTG